MSTAEDAIQKHAQIALKEMQDVLKGKWDLLTPEQRSSAARCVKRLVTLEFKKRTGGDYDELDLAFVKTTVTGFKLIGEIALYDAFWIGVNKALEALGSFLVGAGKGLIPGLGPLLNGIDIGGLIDG